MGEPSLTAPGPKENGYLSKNADGSWTVVAVVQEAVKNNGEPTYTVTPEEMEPFAKTMIGGVLNYEHETELASIGIIEDAWACDLIVDESGALVHSEDPKRMLASLKLIPDNPVAKAVLQQIQGGNMKGVSLGMVAKFISHPDGVTERILQFKELSLVFEGDISGSRLLQITDPDTGMEIEGLPPVPQYVEVTASRRATGDRRPNCWLGTKRTPTDAKRVLHNRITFSIAVNASNREPPTIKMSSPATKPTSADPKPAETGSDVKDEKYNAEQLLKQLNEAVLKQQAAEAALKKKMEEEEVRKFWDTYGQSLKSLMDAGSGEEDSEHSEILQKAMNDPMIVLDKATAGLLAGMAHGYDRASAVSAKRELEPTDNGLDPMEVAASNTKKIRLSDAESNLNPHAKRAAASKSAAFSAQGQDFQAQWRNRVADQNGTVIDPQDGSLKQMTKGPDVPSNFDLDCLLAIAADPANFSFASPQQEHRVTASARTSQGNCIKDAATKYAIEFFAKGSRTLDPSTWPKPSQEALTDLNVCASRGMI